MSSFRVFYLLNFYKLYSLYYSAINDIFSKYSIKGIYHGFIKIVKLIEMGMLNGIRKNEVTFL